MMKDLKLKMITSISEVLETMFYMALEFEEHENLNSCGILEAQNIRICKLEFKGNFSGHFIIFIPESILITMAEDFMGEDRENINREHSDGIIKEVINMVGGSLFACIDNKSEFKLSIPEIIEDTGILSEIGKNPPEGLILAESIEGYLGFIIYINS